MKYSWHEIRVPYNLYYVEELNKFEDDDGNLVDDIFDILPACFIQNWLQTRCRTIMEDRSGGLARLFFIPKDGCNTGPTHSVRRGRTHIPDRFVDDVRVEDDYESVYSICRDGVVERIFIDE